MTRGETVGLVDPKVRQPRNFRIDNGDRNKEDPWKQWINANQYRCNKPKVDIHIEISANVTNIYLIFILKLGSKES